MQKYINQLLEDIEYAKRNLAWPFIKKDSYDWDDIKSDEEEEKYGPRRQLEDWTGIKKEQLPPAEKLSDDQIKLLLKALTDLLSECNWSFVTQIFVPDRIQYHTIRERFDQVAVLKQWNFGFFEMCTPGTEHKKCEMCEYCHCAFFKEFFRNEEGVEHDDREENDIPAVEISYLKRKYGDDWFRYYLKYYDPPPSDEDDELDGHY